MVVPTAMFESRVTEENTKEKSQFRLGTLVGAHAFQGLIPSLSFDIDG